jgi:Chlorite dismutase.
MDFDTKNGWYFLHLFWKIDWKSYKKIGKKSREEQLGELLKIADEFEASVRSQKGSYAFGRVLGHKADFAVMLLHEDIRQLIDWQDRLKRLDLFNEAELVISYLSVCEVTNYLLEKLTEENPYIRKKLYPQIGGDRYFCFYPMNRKSEWFNLPFEERQRMLSSHNRVGKGYDKKISHYVTNSFGLDDHQWAVTLGVNDFEDVKNIVYEMRFDEASAKYGIFPYFITGEFLKREQLDEYFLG